jgi:hypothetical protein
LVSKKKAPLSASFFTDRTYVLSLGQQMIGAESTPDEGAVESCGLLSRRGIFDSYPLDANTDVVNHPTPFAPADLPLDRHPVAVYLASLSPGSRPTMRTALRIIAGVVSPGADELTLPWPALDFAHTTAIRSRIAARFAPSTANRMLAALRGVLRAAFKLRLIDLLPENWSVDSAVRYGGIEWPGRASFRTRRSSGSSRSLRAEPS